MNHLNRFRFILLTLIGLFITCGPDTQPSGVTRLPCGSRGAIAKWSDCKTRCLPDEQLYVQCTGRQGVVFSTRSGLSQPQLYGYTFEPEVQCGGAASVRIWRLTRIGVTRATAGFMSLPSTNTLDCARAYLQDIGVESDRFYYSGVDVTAREAAYLDSMSTVITPASPTQIVQTFNAPADGDIANAASVNVAFQSLENSVEALRFLTYGGGFYPRVKATSNTVMTIQPLGAVVVKQLGVWTAVPHTVATTIDPLALAGGAFAANTRYYVYVNLVAGVITWSVSTTAPDVGWRYKTGDEQYQFVTTFYTDHVPDLLTYTQSGKTYTYTTVTPTGGGVRGNLLLNLGAALAPTNVTTVGGAIPTGVSEYRLYGQAATAAATGVAVLGLALPSANSRVFYPSGTAALPYTQETTWTGITTTTLQYFVDAGTTALNLWALQFTL